MKRNFPALTITDKGARFLRAGHSWVYADEVTAVSGSYEPGELVDVYSAGGRWLGTGFANDHSKIRVRIVTKNPNDRLDETFWRRRIEWAVDYRRAVMGEELAACRLIFGEADGFPGLTVDRYNNVLVTEVLSAGMERIKERLYDILMEQPDIDAIYERSDSPLREKEGLPCVTGFARGQAEGHTVIRENGLLFHVDYINGQKTGFFLDQQENRRAAARFARGRRVLECFTHTGAFAIHAASGGAQSVTAVDISQTALDEAAKNAALNGLDIEFVKADVFELLTQLAAGGRGTYDYILLDPPAFTKSSATLKAAYRGYKEINRKAMQILPRGGFLATCSCSHFMTDELFRRMLSEAAREVNVSLRQAYVGRQAPDHPILWGVPETDYLKYYIFQVV